MKNNYYIDINTSTYHKYDEHWYGYQGEFYPSVTLVLNSYPKGYGFHKWLTEAGENAEKYRDFAADRGSRIHDGCHRLLTQGSISAFEMIGEEMKENFSFDEWENINTFLAWWEDSGMKLLLAEQVVVDFALGVAGTLDILAEDAKGDVWVIDIKTGNKYPSHSLQLAVYAKATEQMVANSLLPVKAPTKAGVLYLGVDTKKKWRLTEVEGIEQEYNVYRSLLDVWKHANPNAKPKELVYPATLKIGGI